MNSAPGGEKRGKLGENARMMLRNGRLEWEGERRGIGLIVDETIGVRTCEE